MTQLGEPVAVGMIDADEVDCPFDHDEEAPPNVDNSLIGKGSTLASRMKSAQGIHLYSKIKDSFEVERILNPRDRVGHPFYSKPKSAKARPVEIAVSTPNEPVVHRYPVSCAAHHCIPAQESLKGSLLLTWMCKKNAPEDLKDEQYQDGGVWSDVGYDVNGSENGIFLPGSYAVGGGRGGLKLWVGNEDGDEDEPEDPADHIPDEHSALLTGSSESLEPDNRKWAYVKQAVALCPGQFHDRHVDYSGFVQGVLNKIHENYIHLLTESYLNEMCEKCKDRAKKFEDLGVPTPYGLVSRLNGVSNKLKACLNGTAWRPNIYTSRWGRAYMEALAAGRNV